MASILLNTHIEDLQEKLSASEESVSLNTNDICAMIHVRSRDAATATSIPSRPSASMDSADSALHLLFHAVEQYGELAAAAAEQKLEALQERFLELLYSRLHKAHIEPSDKLSLSLSPDNTLLIQSAADNEVLLAALGSDVALQDMFVELQNLAIASEGLRYLNRTRQQTGAADDGIARYWVCLKGTLSHFYLK